MYLITALKAFQDALLSFTVIIHIQVSLLKIVSRKKTWLMPEQKTENENCFVSVPFSPRFAQPKVFAKMFVSTKMWKQFAFLIANFLSIKFREFFRVFFSKFFAKVKIFLILAKVFAISSLFSLFAINFRGNCENLFS